MSNPGKLDGAVADKANEAKPKNADDVSNWLYQQCKMTIQTLLTISLAVLQALCNIEVDIQESMDVSDQTDPEFKYTNYFFDAFKGDMYKRRDVYFIYELAANSTQMILDENLNEENIDSARK
jgi:hypothetical protein